MNPKAKELANSLYEQCGNCEGDGRMWADGKAHYSTENRPTVACPSCGGSGRAMLSEEEVTAKLSSALAQAEQDGEAKERERWVDASRVDRCFSCGAPAEYEGWTLGELAQKRKVCEEHLSILRGSLSRQEGKS